MIYTVLRVSVWYDGDLVTVGEVFPANSFEEVSYIIGFGTLAKIQLRVGGRLAESSEVQVEVEGCESQTKILTTVLVMNNIPHCINTFDLPHITNHDTFRSAYKRSLRV